MMKWYGKAYSAKLKKHIDDNLYEAGALLTNYIKQSLVANDNATGKAPSEAGEAPAKVTGRLSSSISHEVDLEKEIARIGTNVKYSKFLEIGTSRMAARPFLRPALNSQRDTLIKIITREMA